MAWFQNKCLDYQAFYQCA